MSSVCEAIIDVFLKEMSVFLTALFVLTIICDAFCHKTKIYRLLIYEPFNERVT